MTNNGVNKETQSHNKSDVRISGIIFEHENDNYELWEDFYLSEEDENAIQQILMKYDTQGFSVKGTKKEIADELNY